jgi:hypothetical protein
LKELVLDTIKVYHNSSNYRFLVERINYLENLKSGFMAVIDENIKYIANPPLQNIVSVISLDSAKYVLNEVSSEMGLILFCLRDDGRWLTCKNLHEAHHFYNYE